MNNLIPNTPNPQSIAELLWHRFGLQDGMALALVLEQPEQRDNRHALLQWVRDRLERYVEKGDFHPVMQLETELACCLIESGLPGGELDVAIRNVDMDNPSTSREGSGDTGLRNLRRRSATGPVAKAVADKVIQLSSRRKP